MTKRRGANGDSGLGIQRLAGPEVEECNVGGKDLGWHGEERRAHEVADRPLSGAYRRLMDGPQPERVATLEGEREERQAEHVVDMHVGQEQVCLGASFLDEGRSKLAKARAGIGDEHRLPAADFDTGGVVAVVAVTRTRGGEAPRTPQNRTYM